MWTSPEIFPFVGSVTQVWKEGCGRARSCVGARQRGRHMHALQKGHTLFFRLFLSHEINFSGSIHVGKSTPSLQKVWSCLLQCLQFKEVKMEICWFNLFLSRFLLPAQSSKPLRVCMTCFDELSSQSADHSFNKGMYAFSRVIRKRGDESLNVTCWMMVLPGTRC